LRPCALHLFHCLVKRLIVCQCAAQISELIETRETQGLVLNNRFDLAAFRQIEDGQESGGQKNGILIGKLDCDRHRKYSLGG
jgi:hypothetical protein